MYESFTMSVMHIIIKSGCDIGTVAQAWYYNPWCFVYYGYKERIYTFGTKWHQKFGLVCMSTIW